jgi:hypothetical protein
MDPADHPAILDLCTRYNRYFDEDHQESWVQTFSYRPESSTYRWGT